MIANLTQHPATAEQVAAGVVDAHAADLLPLLTFDSLPTPAEIEARAQAIAEAAVGYETAMIGGAPWLMGPLTAALRARGIRPLFAFSRRESVEQTLPDGSVRKTAVFRHAGFIDAC